MYLPSAAFLLYETRYGQATEYMKQGENKRDRRLHELNQKLCDGGISSMTERELFELVELYAFGVECPGARESMMKKYRSYGRLIRSDGRGDGSLVQGLIRLVRESALILAGDCGERTCGSGVGKNGAGGASANAARFLLDDKDERLRDICRALASRFYDSAVECFRVTYLDGSGRWLMCEDMAEGSVGEVRVDTKKIFRRAFELGASGILLSHNHPNGDLTPSAADMRFTDRMKVACESVGMTLADHIIVSDGRYRSVIRGDSFSGGMNALYDGTDNDIHEISDSFSYGAGTGTEELGHTGVYRKSLPSDSETVPLSILFDVREEPIDPPEDE